MQFGIKRLWFSSLNLLILLAIPLKGLLSFYYEYSKYDKYICFNITKNIEYILQLNAILLEKCNYERFDIIKYEI